MECATNLGRAHFVARLIIATIRRQYTQMTTEILISENFFTQSSYSLVESIIGEAIIAPLSPIPWLAYVSSATNCHH